VKQCCYALAILTNSNVNPLHHPLSDARTNTRTHARTRTNTRSYARARLRTLAHAHAHQYVPTLQAELSVNGEKVTNKTRIGHGSSLMIGAAREFRVSCPMGRSVHTEHYCTHSALQHTPAHFYLLCGSL
jgi:hypothetical protein